MFFATLGVDGVTLNRMHVTLTKTTALPENMANYQYLSLPPKGVTLSCSEKDESSVVFWPIAFKLSGSTNIRPSKIRCQRDLPGFKPLATAKCVKLKNKPYLLQDSQPFFRINATLRSSSNTSHYASDEFDIKDTSWNVTDPRNSELIGIVTKFSKMHGRAFVQGANAVVVVQDSMEQNLYIVQLQ